MSTGNTVLRGELAAVGVFDISELLRLNRMTGPLVLAYQDRRGMLLFQEGTIVNAVDDRNQEGESAAYRLFGWQMGTFEFRSEPVATSRLIADSTEGLMMEAARRLDEAGHRLDGTPGATAHLRERLSRFAALRDAFHSLSHDSTGAPSSAADDPTAQLESLRDADDRLVLRPLAPPRLRTGSGWVSTSEAVTLPETYAAVRQQLLGPPETRGTRLAMLDGRTLWVQAVGEGADEALWIRPIELDPPAPESLSGPGERLLQHVASPGSLLLVAGRTPERAELLLHTVVELLSHATPERIVVAPFACYSRVRGLGIALDVTPALAPAAIECTRPSLVAVEAGVTLAAPLASALARVPHVVIGVVAADPASAAARVTAALDIASAGALLNGGRVAIACEEARQDDRLGFSLNAMPGALGGVRAGAGTTHARAPQI